MLLTYDEAVDHVIDFLGQSVSGSSVRDAKRACIQALRDIANAHPWRYFINSRLLTTDASQTSSTITYDHTGGAAERLVTIAAGTWPTWAARGKLKIGEISYDVATYESTTTITLSPNSNPGADVAAGTAYTLYRNHYPLPLDFIKLCSRLIDQDGKYAVRYVTPERWLHAQTVFGAQSEPFEFTIMGDPSYQNVMSVVFSAAPSTARTLEYLYQRRSRDLKVYAESTGTVAVTTGAATLTGTGTEFADKHIGSVVRISDSATTAPTHMAGDNPFAMERIITAVASATAATLDENADQTLSGVKYRISDPVDMEQGAMQNAYFRQCENLVSHMRVSDTKRDYASEARTALIIAKETDNRVSRISRSTGTTWPYGITETILEHGTLSE
jgi:hypothetical protein